MLKNTFSVIFILFTLLILYQINLKFNNCIFTESFKNNNNSNILKLKIANTNHQRKKGLMFVKKMLPYEGMLFDYKIDGYHSVWMKNTFIPLDVLFLNSQYKIIDYIENTIPHNLDSISISKKSRYILEVNAGTVKRIKLKKGEKINFKIIKNLS
tara:strand:+ start:5002 stop:5466 length:465 start_codon:yes stop_codon:yes gene_type:complete